MKAWLHKLGQKLSGFMDGRYGNDELNRALSISGLILLLLSMIPKLRFLYALALAALFWSWFRSLSKNHARRQEELETWIRLTGNAARRRNRRKNKWANRKTHRYYRCPNCKTDIRVKKPDHGKKIIITCPSCQNVFQKTI